MLHQLAAYRGMQGLSSNKTLYSCLTPNRKVGHVLFNPSAQNVLASASGDFTVKLWDIETGKDRLVLKHNEVVQSMSWSADGAYLVTTSRDKKLRFWDVRQEKPAQEVPVRSYSDTYIN
jgi:coronin-1B/1C/6